MRNKITKSKILDDLKIPQKKINKNVKNNININLKNKNINKKKRNSINSIKSIDKKSKIFLDVKKDVEFKRNSIQLSNNVMLELSKNNIKNFKKDEYKEKSEEEKCFICKDKDSNICFFPCQHGGICLICVPKLKNCHLCNQEIKIIFILERKIIKNKNEDQVITFEIKDFIQPKGLNEVLIENQVEDEYSEFDDY